MRKPLLLSAFLLFAPSLYAQCTNNGGSPQAWSCPAGTTTADLNTVISTAVDGAVVTFAAGTYTNIIYPKFSNAKGITFICASAPPTGTVAITAWSITSNVVTFTATNSLVAGQTVDVTSFPTSTFLNQPFTVLAAGLSGTKFEGNLLVAHANGSATEAGVGKLEAGADPVNPCHITAVAGSSATNNTFGSDIFSGTNTHFYRISGFLLDNGSLTKGPNFGTIYIDSANGGGNATLAGPNAKGGLRIDHNTFTNYPTGKQSFLCGSVSPPSIMNCYGVLDHNLYVNPTTISSAIWVGLFPNPVAVPIGTVNNFFIEDNVYNFDGTGNTSAEGCVDNWIGAYVIRYNSVKNCLWLAHGETHLGGPTNFEFYNNRTTITDTTTGVGDCNEMVHLQGSGTAMMFNNRCTPASGHTINGFQLQHYRGGAGTAGNTFSVSAVTVGPGSAITYTGTGLASAPLGWYNFSGFVNAGNNTFTQITSVTATTLTGITTRSLLTQVNESSATATANYSSQDGSSPQCDGTVAPPSTLVWATTAPDGNRSPVGTYHGYPCGNQPGRDLAGNIQPYYLANNLFTDNGAKLPLKVGGVGGLDYFAQHMQDEREWFDEVGNTAQTTPTAPFNGTTGSGWGTLANRPTTCTTNATENAFGAGTSGVGYYATDTGAQGTWYKCTGTNTWTAFYTPFTYPHPLVSGSVVALAPTFSLASGSYLQAQSVTIGNPSSAPVVCYSTAANPVTNGSNGCTIGSVYSGAIPVTASLTLRAVAGGTGFLDSPVAVANYSIGGSTAVPILAKAVF